MIYSAENFSKAVNSVKSPVIIHLLQEIDVISFFAARGMNNSSSLFNDIFCEFSIVFAALFTNTTMLFETSSSSDASVSFIAVNTISPALIGLLPSTFTLQVAFSPFLVVAVIVVDPLLRPTTS